MKMSDVKNEATIIIISNELFNLWAKFIIAHSNKEFIDLDTRKKFNESKHFDYGPRFQLHQGVF